MQLPKFYRNLRVQTAIKSLIAELEVNLNSRQERLKQFRRGKTEPTWWGGTRRVEPNWGADFAYSASVAEVSNQLTNWRKKLKVLETFPPSSRIGLTVQEVHDLFSGRPS